MRLHLNIVPLLTLVTALALTGCGTSASPSASTLRGPGNIAKVSFSSTAIKSSAKRAPTIPALYTCDGENKPPPLRWGSVPAHTGELVLFVLGLKPIAGTRNVSISVEWAMAGINPALHHFDPAHLPQGAHPGLTASHTRGYSVCPKRGLTEQYVFELYGLPEGDAVPLNFEGLGVLTKLVTTSRETIANSHGSFGAIYKRA